MLQNHSTFYYGFKVTAQPYNGYMNIDEGSGELQIEIPVGTYTFTTLADAIRNALLTQGTLDYTVTINRDNRLITISAPTNFDLLTNTGVNSGTAIWDLIGFDTTSDLTGSNSYTSYKYAGFEYMPQFRLQEYTGPEDFQAANQASKNVAANGTTVEVVRFGLAKFIEFNIRYITSRTDFSDGYAHRHDPLGLENARAFLQSITELSEFEFMPDYKDTSNYYRCIVESMPDFPDGTGYRLQERFADNLIEVYDTGRIKLRVID